MRKNSKHYFFKRFLSIDEYSVFGKLMENISKIVYIKSDSNVKKNVKT